MLPLLPFPRDRQTQNFGPRFPGDHWLQVWWRSSNLTARTSDFRASTKVPVSRDLWPWAHPGCTLTWSPSCTSLMTIRPFAREKKRFAAQKFTDGRTDGQTTDAARLYKLMEWANKRIKTISLSRHAPLRRTQWQRSIRNQWEREREAAYAYQYITHWLVDQQANLSAAQRTTLLSKHCV